MKSRKPSARQKARTPARAAAARAVSRPFEPGRAAPPVPITDDLEEFVAPPIPGKLHPPEEMDEATPTLDDEKRSYHHHPNDAGAVAFGFDPDAADAAADLAGDLGSAFLSGATRGQDMSDLAMLADDRADEELTIVPEEAPEETEAEELPRPSVARRPHRR